MRHLRALTWAAVLVLAGCFAWRTETSRDFPYHVATGLDILAHRAWPQVDTFTWTRAGAPYVDMHGLFQVAAALAWRGWGMLGVGALRVALVLATLGFVWSSARRRGVSSPTLLGLGFGLALCAWELRFMMRPERATDLCLAVMMWLLLRHARGDGTRWLWATIPLQFVWVLSHALSPFGIAVLGLYAVASLAGGLRRRAIDPAPWIALAGATVTLFLNPYGAEGVAFLWHLRTRIQEGNPFGESILELMSPFSSEAAGVRPLLAFKLLLAATAIAVLARLRRLTIFDVAVVAMFGILAAMHVRNVGLFAIVATPIALEAANGIAARWRSSSIGAMRGRVAVTAGVVLALLVPAAQAVTGAWYAANHRPVRFGAGESPAVYPIATTARLDSLRGGPLFNTLDLGGYVTLHRPERKVYIDGRLEVVGEDFYRGYSAVVSGAGWTSMVARDQPAVALVSRASHALVRRIHADSSWKLVDVDGAAVLFARDLAPHREAIRSAEARLAHWNAPVPADSEAIAPPPPRAAKLFGAHRTDFEAWGRGNSFMVMGLLHAARREYRRALLESDRLDPAIVKSYVAVTVRLERFDEAEAWCRRLVELTPDDVQARGMLVNLSSR